MLTLGAGFVFGLLFLVALRFAAIKDTHVHYHANFALYVNGVRDEFASPTFYEETQSCSADEIGPKARVHMHDQKSQVVHIHDDGVTWGHLFANLGYGLSGKAVQTDKGVFSDGQDGNKLTFILNGKKIESMANETIMSEDVLLINYGRDDEKTLQSRFESIEKSAAGYNAKSDPSTCSGSNPLTFTERLKKAIGISE